MKYILAVLAALGAVTTFANTYTAGPWVLYRSGSAQTPTYSTPADCDAALQAQPLTVGQKVTFRCQQTTTAVGTASSSSSSSSVSSSSSSASSSSSSSSSTTATWTHCANEGARCAFTGSRSVRFGIGSTWDTRTYTGGVTCNTTWFADPAPGLEKTCQLQSSSSSSSSTSSSTSSSSSSATTGSASLTWTAPTQNTDGSDIASLTGYRLYYNTTGGAIQSVSLGNVTSHTLSGLSAGTWYFRIATISTDGEGPQSNAASKTL